MFSQRDENSEYLDIQSLSQHLGIKVSTLYSLAAERKIPHYRVGRLIRFKKEDINLWMESQKEECADIPKAARKIMRAAGKPARDINRVVKKAVADAKGRVYTASHGKPDQVKGLGKEGLDGTL